MKLFLVLDLDADITKLTRNKICICSAHPVRTWITGCIKSIHNIICLVEINFMMGKIKNVIFFVYFVMFIMVRLGLDFCECYF